MADDGVVESIGYDNGSEPDHSFGPIEKMFLLVLCVAFPIGVWDNERRLEEIAELEELAARSGDDGEEEHYYLGDGSEGYNVPYIELTASQSGPLVTPVQAGIYSGIGLLLEEPQQDGTTNGHYEVQEQVELQY